ncbi:MAG: UDP-N-acetylglucosamine 1-carboxyvinyltransferase [Eubacterium sp.]
MQYLEINGNKRLNGEITLHGSKNSVLPILAGAVLINGECVIHNCPRLSDVDVTLSILRYLGARVEQDKNDVFLDTSTITKTNIPEHLMKEMRSSIIFLGALVARFGEACLYLPGGCEIGLRPIDLHLKALTALGYPVCCNGHDVCAVSRNPHGKRIVLAFPSVGATENIILSATLTEGVTTIVNAAREPEIADLVCFLNKAGARISGASTPVITIEGVKSLHSVEHRIIPDRILATTLMSAAAITKGDITINDVNLPHIMPTLPVFEEMGCSVHTDNSSLRIFAPERLSKVKMIETMAFPGFPTDCQAPVMAALTVANGTSVIKETIFESRFKHISQLNIFGADISVNDRMAVINGVDRLNGASVVCTDLRGGAAVVIEALASEGMSKISDIHHIDRGYEKIENQLTLLGADIKRKDYEKKEGTKKKADKSKR